MANTAGTGLFAFDPARCDALSQVLAERWWAVGLRGILAIIFGLLSLLTPGIAIGALVLLFATYMLVDGVFAIISGIRAARSGERWGLLVLEGLVDLAAGAIRRHIARDPARRARLDRSDLGYCVWCADACSGLCPQSRLRPVVTRAWGIASLAFGLLVFIRPL